jgi:hypothetical protein
MGDSKKAAVVPPDYLSARINTTGTAVVLRAAADLLLEEVVTESGFVAVTVPGLQMIVDAFRTQWPGLRPYKGRFGAQPAAHVTVAMGADNPKAAAHVRAAIGSLLPLHTRATAVQLVVLTEEGWQPRFTVPLGVPDGP